MATLDDVTRIIAAFPGVTEGERHGHRTWFVGKKGFAWERPFTKADIKRFGAATPPDGPIIAVAVEDLGEKEAVLGAHGRGLFTIAHFEGYPAVLIQLNAIAQRLLRSTLSDAWLTCAPSELAAAYLQEQRRG